MSQVPRKPPSVSPPVQVQTQQQARGPQHHFATRGQTPPIPYRQLSQEEFQRNQVYQQQQFSGFAAGSTAHDHMNKQQMQTHVPGPGQSQAQAGLQQQVMYQAQQHQGGQPRPGTPGGNTAISGAGYPPVGGGMYHNPGAAQLGPSNMEEGGVSFTIPRQTVPQTMRGGQQRQPLTMASSPGTIYNNPGVHTTMYVQGQPPPPYIPGQHQVIIQQGPPPPLQVPPQYQGARAMPTSFTITTSQPNYGMPQPTHNFYNPQAGNGGYFMSATPAIVPQQTQRPMDQQQQQPAQQPYQKRKRNIIRIVDPNSGRDISDEIMSSGTKSNTPPQSGPNSARATPVSAPPGPPSGVGPSPVAAYSPNATPPPPVPQTKENQVDIAAQFAAQVAATLSQKTGQQQQQQQRQQSPQLPPQAQMVMQQQMAQHPQQVAQAPTAEVAQEPSVPEVQAAVTPNDSEAESSHERSASREPSEPREVSPAGEPAAVAEETVVKPQVAVPVTITPPTPEATQKKAEVETPTEPEVVAEKVEEKGTEEVREKEVEVEKEQDSKAEESRPREVTKAPSEPREVSREPSEPRDSKRGPSEQRDAKRVPSEPRDTKRGPSEPRDVKRVPSEPRDTKPKEASVEPRDVQSEVKDSDKPKATTEGRATPESDTAAKDDAKDDFKEVEGKDKRKSKKKLKEQNHKADSKPDSKEGSDMDTPNVPAATAAAATEPAQPTLTQQAPQEQQQQQQTQQSREQTPEVVKKVEKEVTSEPEPAKPAVAPAVVREASPAPAPAPASTPAQPSAPNNKEKEEEASLDKVEIKVVEDEKVAEKNEKNEETRRRVLPPQDDLWRKSNNTNNTTNMDAPWRKSPAVPGEEDLWRKPVSEKLNEEPPKKVVESKSEKVENNEANDSDKTNSSSKNSDSNTPVIQKDTPELKYHYKEGQWSPANQDGRKAYDRNFLLQMQYSSEGLEKPDGLPRLPDVILDKPLIRHEPTGRGLSSPKDIDFTPGFVKSTQAKVGNQGIRNRSQHRDRDKPGGGRDMMGGAKKIISISRDLMDTKLHTTANAWKPGQQKSLMQGDTETKELLSVMRSILNKLTPQKFQVLLKQIQGLKLDNAEKLRGTIDLVFEKAIDEPAFSSTYANLCRCMNSLKVPLDEQGTDFINFRKLLLVRCQAEFEKDRTEEAESEQRQKVIDEKEKELAEKGTNKELEDEIKKLKAEKMYLEAKARRRTLGNIRFIGELFKLGILNETIMHNCITKLLGQNDEDSLECLCKLLMTIGKNIDSDDKAKAAKVDTYFKKLTQLSQDRKICARIRFMIQDVLDLRKDKWVPRRDDNAPKTIDALHKEIQQEDQQKAQLIANISAMPMPKHGGAGGSHERGRRGRGPGNMDDGGWTPVAKPLRSTQSIEPGRMKITKQNFDNDNIQLGPSSGFSGWGRGSTGGGGAGKSREQNKGSLSLNTPNKYEALSRHSDSRRDGFESSSRSESTGRGGMASRERDRDRDSRDSKGGWSTQKSKFGSRASQDDREAALSAVSKSLGGVSRNMMSGQRPSTTPTGSRNQSMELGRREGTREREPEPAPAAPVISEAEIRRKTKALMDEYLGILDVKEAVACVKELESPSKMHIMVSTAMNHVIEKNKAGRQNTGQLLARLITAKLITPTDYIKGLDEVVELAEDMAIDIPKIYAYMGEVIGPTVETGTIELPLLAKAFAPLLSSGKAGVLMAEVLNDAVTRKDEKTIGETWAASGLKWSDLIGKDDVNEFARRYKVEYTLTASSSGNSTAGAPEQSGKLSMKQIQDQLDLLITEKKAKDDEVFEWVMTNVGDRCREPAFVRALMTCVCNSAISGSSSSNMKVDNQVVINRSAMLMKYLDHKPQLELQGLYALQALVHRLDHPAGILRNFFDVLYDEDIISEDAFTHWETSTDAAEQAGKGVALKSVVQFFTWLREADEESPDDN